MNNTFAPRRLALHGALILAVIIVIGSLMPKDLLAWMWNRSALIHFTAYGLMGFLLRIATNGRWRQALLILIGLTLFGCVVELLQIFFPYRRALVEDAAINALGAFAGVAGGEAWRWLWRRGVVKGRRAHR